MQVEAADAGRALADAARGRGRRGRGRRRHRDDVLRLQGRHRRGEPRRAAGATVGVLVLANFGARARAAHRRRAGRAPARCARRRAARGPRAAASSVVATDAPLHPAQLERIARRAGLGLARTGSVAHHGSGEIFLAFSTARGADRARRRRARPALRGDRRRDRGGRRQRAVERRARRRPRGPRRRGAAARGRRRACSTSTGASERRALGIWTKSVQKHRTHARRSCSIAPDHAGAGPAGSDTGGALACGQGARRLLRRRRRGATASSTTSSNASRSARSIHSSGVRLSGSTGAPGSRS